MAERHPAVRHCGVGWHLTENMIVEARYRLDSPLGEGGYGAVWRATRLVDGQSVAIKFLKLDGRVARQRFEREADVLRRLDHPHCVSFIEFGVNVDGDAFIVSELLEGQTLQRWKRQPRELPEIIEVLRQLTLALQAAHREGVVHRDLKPANIVVSPPLHVKVLDFGIAKLLADDQGDITQTGEVFGTPGFMSPEQLRGLRDLGPPSDFYCLGAIAFELLEGRPPFGGNSPLEIGMAHLLEPVPQLDSRRPAALAELVRTLLAKEPRDRPATATAVLQALAGIAGGRSALPASPRTTTEPSALPWRRVAIPAVVVVALLLRWGTASRDEPSRHVPPPPPESVAAADQVAPPPPPAPPVVDAAPDRETGDAARSVGCANPNADLTGTKRLAPGSQLIRGVRVRLPDPYDPRHPHPVVVLFHEDGQSPEEMLAEVNLDQLANERRYVLIAPNGAPPQIAGWNQTKQGGAWQTEAVRAGWSDAWNLGEHLCFDDRKIFVIGHGFGGGRAGNKLACDDAVAAVVLSSFRHETDDPAPCRAPQAPVLDLTPLADEADAPVNGRPQAARGRHGVVSLRDHENFLSESHGCSSERRAIFTADGSTCYAWDACTHALYSCHINGGRHWPGYGTGLTLERTKFPYQMVVGDFFNDPEAFGETRATPAISAP